MKNGGIGFSIPTPLHVSSVRGIHNVGGLGVGSGSAVWSQPLCLCPGIVRAQVRDLYKKATSDRYPTAFYKTVYYPQPMRSVPSLLIHNGGLERLQGNRSTFFRPNRRRSDVGQRMVPGS